MRIEQLIENNESSRFYKLNIKNASKYDLKDNWGNKIIKIYFIKVGLKIVFTRIRFYIEFE